jgi:hypothetical protein
VTSCCAEVAGCGNDSTCLDCETGAITDLTICKASTPYKVYEACKASSCAACLPTYCNPVSNAGCTTAGSACDVVSTGDYVCFDPPPANNLPLCATCYNDSTGPYCKHGLHCTDPDGYTGGECAAFCCTNADCGGSGTCDKTGVPGGVGLCLTTSGAAVCSAPSTPPSGGSCYTIP